MKNLIKRHHAATWERGLITPNTGIDEFVDKLNEEVHEFRDECWNNLQDLYSDHILSPEMVHEAVDICAVLINMLKHYGYDFMEEYRKNVEYQESKVK